MRHRMNWLFVATGMMVIVMGCGGSRQLTPTEDRPKWIDQGAGFFKGDKGKAFYAVGSASNVSSPSLRRNVADAQARADLARVFKTKVENLVKVYSRSISGGLDNRESPEQFAQEATKVFTSMELSGAQIVNRYYDQKERTEYALAMLDVTAFKNQVEQMRELSREMQELIKENADKAFQELEQEEQNRR
ncbi:MAG: LPP20 family lipoprotein [Candidatus Latescibacteria bacterium]|nr:LPP20 family lipoprotein [Candidatus Latescibacterota bacterium]